MDGQVQEAARSVRFLMRFDIGDIITLSAPRRRPEWIWIGQVQEQGRASQYREEYRINWLAPTWPNYIYKMSELLLRPDGLSIAPLSGEMALHLPESYVKLRERERERGREIREIREMQEI